MKRNAIVAGLLLAFSYVTGMAIAAPAPVIAPPAASAAGPCAAFGTAAGTCAQGNDTRITGAAPTASPTFSGVLTIPTGTAGAPTIASSNSATTGIFFDTSNQINFDIAGTAYFQMTNVLFYANSNSTGFLITRSSPTATFPVFVPNRSKTNAGIGADTAGDVSLVVDNSGSGLEALRATSTSVQMKVPATLPAYTVSTLPTGAQGMIAIVTDANAACTYNSAPTGSGSTKCKVWYNGSAWVEG